MRTPPRAWSPTKRYSRNPGAARSWGVIGEPRTPLIIRHVYLGLVRFDDLVDDLGVARNVLSVRLAGLVANGVFERRPYRDGGRTRHEYALTPMGRDLCPVLIALMSWGDRWLAGADGPPMRLVHLACGGATDAVAACSACGEPLGADDLVARAGPGGRRVPGTALVAGVLSAKQDAPR